MSRYFRAAAVLAVLSTAAAPLAAQTNSFVAGSQVNSPALTGFSTLGNQMIGMDVTWTLATGGSFSAAWADLGAGVCGATFGGFSVTLGCGTNSFGGLWTVTGGNDRLASVRFNGRNGRTLFDCDWDDATGCQNTGAAAADEGTVGSANGWSLTSVGGTYNGGITGVYSNRVSVAGDPAVGDLYEELTINFDAILGAGATYTFNADTDNSSFDAPPPTVVPEPSTYALMFAGLMGIGAMARRRRNV